MQNESFNDDKIYTTTEKADRRSWREEQGGRRNREER